MKDRILQAIFSASGLALVIAVAGFLSAIVTMFVDVNATLSVKWLLFMVFVATCLITILLKLVHDLARTEERAAPFERPIKYISDERIFIIRRNENFANSIVVGCYSHQDDVDRLAYVAVVHLVQDKVIQIKIHNDLGLLKRVPSTPVELQTLVIRPVVPVTALHQYQNSESQA